MIDLTKYQQQIKQFYTPEVEADLLTYSRELLVSEVGEVIGLRAKRRRGDARLQDDSAYRAAVIDEMGDVLWALASIWTSYEMDFEVPEATAWAETYELENVIQSLQDMIESEGDEDFLAGLFYYATREKLYEKTIETIAARNIEKLQVRAANNLIRGSGHGEKRA